MSSVSTTKTSGSVSTTSTTSTSTTSLINHRCYDWCEYWRGPLGGCVKGFAPHLVIRCEEFVLKEELRIINKGW